MNQLTILNKNGGLVVDSREVSLKVEKRHDNLIRDIKGYVDILTNSTLRTLDFFIEDTYLDIKGETRPCYLLTKKGCDMIANKMTGKKGVIFTAEYINAFENMKDIIQTNSFHLIGEIENLKKGLEEVKQYYRLPHSEKLSLNKRIKSRLGISHTKEEIEDVKEYVFMNTGIEKWEDLPIEQRITVIDLIDRRCKIIVESRNNLFNWNKL